MKAKTAIPTTNPISPVIEPTIMHPQQFTIPNHSYVIPQPPSINTASIPQQQPPNVITVGNATYVRIHNNNNPYAASSNTSAMLSSNKNVTHKRTFQSALNTEKLRHSRQHDLLQLRRSDRENRLQQKREVLRNHNHKIIDLTDNYNNQSKVSNIDTTNGNRAEIVSNNKETVISNNKKEILESKTQQLILNNNKKTQPADNSQKRDIKYQKLLEKLRKSESKSCASHPQIDESRRREKFPTLEEIDELKDGEYFVYDKEVIVRCNYKEKDGCSVGFSCPFCFDKYKKNGQPYKQAKASKHFHGCGSKHIKNGAMGSCGTRSPHCTYVYPKDGGLQLRMAPVGIEFHLYVTPSTKVE